MLAQKRLLRGRLSKSYRGWKVLCSWTCSSYQFVRSLAVVSHSIGFASAIAFLMSMLFTAAAAAATAVRAGRSAKQAVPRAPIPKA